MFSYLIDAAGNLIRLRPYCDDKALIPYASELVSSAQELAHPLPWTVTVADALKEIRFQPKMLVKGTFAQRSYEAYTLEISPYVFVAPSKESAPDEQAQELMDIYDQCVNDLHTRTEIEKTLASVGISRIPYLSNFSSAIHSGSVSVGQTNYLRSGWLSYRKLYRKACYS